MNYDDIPIPTHNKVNLTSKNQLDIQAYLEYRNIVGTDDNGKLMSEEEYEAYKKKVAPARKNKLYVFWINSTGFECKAIGPESMCFCNHRYKYHNFDSVNDKKVNCKDKKCKCKLYDYVPVYGANDVKCLCHHSYREHELGNRKCKRNNCKCTKFGSKFTCNCGEGYDTHKTVIYTKEERIKMGKPVETGWFGESLIGVQDLGGLMNDVYETEFKNMEKEPIGKKVMYKNGIPVQQKNNIMGMNYNDKDNVMLNNNMNYEINYNNNMNKMMMNKNIGNIPKKNVNPQNFYSSNNGGTDYYNKNYKNSNK